MKELVIATVTIHGAGKMSQRGRELIAHWLSFQANELVAIGSGYSQRFTASYRIVNPKEIVVAPPVRRKIRDRRAGRKAA